MGDKSKTEYKSLDPIQDAMGVMGPWQIIITIALSLINFPVAWHQLSITVLAPGVNYTCISPLPNNPKDISEDHCEVKINGTMEKCMAFEYDKSEFQSTIISEWNLVCDRKQLANLVQLLTQLGILIGNMLFGVIADKIGRKIPLMIAVISQSLIGMLIAFMPMFELFLVFKFISAIATGGTMLVSFVIIMEIVGIEWRSKISVLFHIPFLLGFLSVSGISWLTGTWNRYLLAVSIPPYLLISYYWLVPESPRWLLAVGKVKKARKVLEAAAKKNKIPQEKVNIAIESHQNDMSETDNSAQKTYSIMDLLRTPNMRIKTLCITVNWFVCGICFFGVNHYLSQFGSNVLINIAVSAAIQLPGIFLVYVLISRMSRLKILISSNLISGICLLLIIPVSNYEMIRVSLAIVGLTGMTISFPTIYLYTGEVFPTVVRNNGFAVCSVSARVGSMIAPFIATIGGGSWLPPVLFGAGPIIGSALCYFLPETMDCKLPETIEDGENFKRKKSSSTESVS